MKTTEIKKIFAAPVNGSLEMLEELLGLDYTLSMKDMFLSVIEKSPKIGTLEYSDVCSAIQCPVYTLGYVQLLMQFKRVRVLDFELADFYNFDKEGFYTVFNSFIVFRKGNQENVTNIQKMCNEIERYHTDLKMEFTLLDRAILIIEALLIRGLDNFVAVLSNFVLTQLNLYLNGLTV